MLAFILSFILLPLLFLKKLNFSWVSSSSSLLLLTPFLYLNLYAPAQTSIFYTKWLTLDSIRLLLIILTSWISALIIIARYQTKILSSSPHIFLSLILLLNIFLILSFSVNNMLIFYISFERTLIPTLLIILGWGYQPERIQAGLYLILYTVLSSLPLLIRISLIFHTSFSTNFFYPFYITPVPLSISSLWWVITIMAFLTKMPIYTLHLWLPKAHVEAPVAGSIILAGLLLKLGRYGLLRITFLFQNINKFLLPYISRLRIWGAVITSLICMRQPDIKSLIAYSSVGHMALLTTGIISNSIWGQERAILIIIAHGLCSSSLFALANIQYEITQTRNILLSKGILNLFPLISIFWFIAISANIAAPPSLNLISEIILLSSILSISPFIFMPLITSSFLAAGYSLFLFTSTQHGAPLHYSNPLHLFTSRNYITLSLHLLPLFLLALKIQLVLS